MSVTFFRQILPHLPPPPLLPPDPSLEVQFITRGAIHHERCHSSRDVYGRRPAFRKRAILVAAVFSYNLLSPRSGVYLFIYSLLLLRWVVNCGPVVVVFCFCW